MSDMKCFQCVLKHLAAALSFGKQVISGHDQSNQLDHRIDFLGEITNAEQHLQEIDKELFNEISNFRKYIQQKDINVISQDLSLIRSIFRKTQMLKNNETYKETKDYTLTENPDIVYINVSNKEYFDFSYNMLKNNLKDYNNVYVLGNIDVSEYQEIVYSNQSLREFMSSQSLTPDVIFITENTTIINPISAKNIQPSYLNKKDNIQQLYKQMSGITSLFYYENLKPQPINVHTFNQIINKDYNNFTSAYFNLSGVEKGVNDSVFSVEITKPICCSIKAIMKVKKFARWNQNGFQAIKKYFKY